MQKSLAQYLEPLNKVIILLSLVGYANGVSAQSLKLTEPVVQDSLKVVTSPYGITYKYQYFHSNEYLLSTYRQDTLLTTCTYKSGLKHGQHFSFYPDGNIQSIATYVDGLQIGYVASFFQNGKPEYTGYFDQRRKALVTELDSVDPTSGLTMSLHRSSPEGQRTGNWYFYSENGVLMKIVEY